MRNQDGRSPRLKGKSPAGQGRGSLQRDTKGHQDTRDGIKVGLPPQAVVLPPLSPVQCRAREHELTVDLYAKVRDLPGPVALAQAQAYEAAARRNIAHANACKERTASIHLALAESYSRRAAIYRGERA